MLRIVSADFEEECEEVEISEIQHDQRLVNSGDLINEIQIRSLGADGQTQKLPNVQTHKSVEARVVEASSNEKGRINDNEVLVCRLIDRPLRPIMLKGFYHLLALTAAGITVSPPDIPSTKTIAVVRIGLDGNKFIVNPTTKEMECSELDLVIAGTNSSVLMIEGYCLMSEEKLLQDVEVGQDADVKVICVEEVKLVKQSCGKPRTYGAIKLPPQDRHVEEVAGNELVQVLRIHNKISRRKALSLLEDQVINILTEKGYVSKGKGLPEILPELSKDEDDEVVEDRGVDDGDVHVKPVTRKATLLLYSEFDVKLAFEEVKVVPDRRESIDEEQMFGVIVGYAQTPNRLSRLLGYVRELGPWRIITIQGKMMESQTIIQFPSKCRLAKTTHTNNGDDKAT
ncbi:hypothetical protein QQ045_009381 [Rhodiola kirilowii]